VGLSSLATSVRESLLRAFGRGPKHKRGLHPVMLRNYLCNQTPGNRFRGSGCTPQSPPGPGRTWAAQDKIVRAARAPGPQAFILPIIQEVQSFSAGPHPKAAAL
jgi:hypothetical protein